MSTFKKTIIAATVAGGLSISASANAFVSFWFDADGAGAGTAVLVNEYLDYTGAVYAENTYTTGTAFTLQQNGYVNITGADGVLNPGIFGANMVARFSGGGSGDLSTGLTSFSGGLLEVFQPGFPPGGSPVASFDILGGGAVISPISGAPNGASTLNLQASSITAGYFFFDNAGVMGADFASTPAELIFNFATSNLSLIANQGAVNLVQNQLNQAFPGNTFSGANVYDSEGRLTNLYSGGNGQDRFNVPEPGSLALLGLGLMGLGAVRRRKQSI